MGRKTRRNTAKTGDRALKKIERQRDEERDTKKYSRGKKSSFSVSDEHLYDEVDRFHNQRDDDFIRLSQFGEKEDDELDQQLNKESVLNLGGGVESSSEEDEEEEEEEEDAATADDEQEEEEEEEEVLPSAPKRPWQGAAGIASDDEDDDDVEDDEDNVRNWGREKALYYHGDTADLEIGQDQEDAFDEEEAAQQVEAARLATMQEDDYLLSDDDDENVDTDANKPQAAKDEGKKTTTDTSFHSQLDKWSSREKRRFLKKQHVEFLPLLEQFTPTVHDFVNRTDVVVRALLEDPAGTAAKSVGTTPDGERYLIARAMQQASVALNLALYLLLKEDHAKEIMATKEKAGNKSKSSAFRLAQDDAAERIQSHPVLEQLQKLHSLGERLQKSIQVQGSDDNAVGLEKQLDNLVKAAGLLAQGEVDEDGDDKRSDASDDEDEEVEEVVEDDDDENDSSDDGDDKVQIQRLDTDASEERRKLRRMELASRNEARFGLRVSEIPTEKPDEVRRRRRAPVSSDFGENSDDDEATAANAKSAPSRSLAATMNTLEQKLGKRKRKTVSDSEHLDERGGDDDAARRGLEMMEAELGRLSDEDKSDDEGDIDPELEDDEDDFYEEVARRSKSKKEERKKRYAVAPKFPRADELLEGERPIGYKIMKNRGMVPHKNKLNRNPRVKKREQYRKALIRRRGAVRDVRDPQEGHYYGGEETGIKSTISRSRKLT